MRKLKKTVALLLAMVMTMSLLSVNAWAAKKPASVPSLSQSTAAPAKTDTSKASAPSAATAAPVVSAGAPTDASVAKIGGNYYDTLEAAIEAASGKTEITLIADILDHPTIQIPAGKIITLDLAGHKIEARVNTEGTTLVQKHDYAFSVYGGLTIKDSVEGGYVAGRGIMSLESGKLTLDSGEIRALDSNGGAAVWNEAEFVMNGGRLYAESSSATSDYGAGALNVQPGATATINAGTIDSNSPRTYAIITNGTTTIETAVVNGTHGALSCDAGQLTVKDGTFNVKNYYAMYTSNDGGDGGFVVIKAGTFGKGSVNGQSVHVGSDVHDPVDAANHIEGGTFAGKIVVENKVTADAGVTITGGTFGDVATATKYLAEGYEIDATTGLVTPKAVAKVGDETYGSLQDAVDAAQDGGTVTVLKDVLGGGVKTKSGYKVTIDFDGHTYSVNPTVGSPGTETNGFQFLKGSIVTLKNGKLRSPTAKILLQNYCDLTLVDMDLDLTEDAPYVQYAASNNNGSLTVKGNTVIKASPAAGYGYAFDLWYGMYDTYFGGIDVTFDEDFTGEVVGKVEYGRNNNAKNKGIDDWRDKTVLNINSPEAKFDLTFQSGNSGADDNWPDGANINIKGGTFTSEPNEKYIVSGYKWDAESKSVIPVAELTEEVPTSGNAVAAVSGSVDGVGDVTVEMTSAADQTITLTEPDTTFTSSVENTAEAVDLTSLVLAALDEAENATDVVKTGSNTLEVGMSTTYSQTVVNENQSKTIMTDIKPVFKINGIDKGTIDNQFIKAPMKVRLPGFITAGWKLIGLLHDGVAMDLSKVTVYADGTVEFESDSFSPYQFTIAQTMYHAFDIELVKNIGTDASKDINKNDLDEYKAADTVTYNITMKANEDNILVNGLDFNLTVPDGLSLSSVSVWGTDHTAFKTESSEAGKYAFVAESDAKQITLSKDESATIGQLVFEVKDDAAAGTKQTFALTNVKAKESKVNERVVATSVSATATVEIDPQYTITINAGEYVNTSKDTVTEHRVAQHTYTIRNGLTAAIAAIDVPDGYDLANITVKSTDGNNWVGPFTGVSALQTEAERDDTHYGDVTLVANFTAKKYKIEVFEPEVTGLVRQSEYNSTASKTYWYDITGTVYADNNGSASTIEAAIAEPAGLTAYTHNNFKSGITASGETGNWTTALDIAPGETESEGAITNDPNFVGQFGTIALYAQYTPIEYTIFVKNPAVDDTTKVIKTGEAAGLVEATPTPSYTYTVEGKVSKTSSTNVVIADSTLTYYTFKNYTVETDPTEVGNATWGAKNAVVSLGEDKTLGAGKYGNVTLKANYTPTTYTATLTLTGPDGTPGAYADGAAPESYDEDKKQVTYTIEDTANTGGFFGTPEFSGYTFTGWTAERENEDETISSKWSSSDPKTDTQGTWGNVKLTAHWKINGMTKAVNYRYAGQTPGDGDNPIQNSLILFAVETANMPAHGAYTFKNAPMFKVTGNDLSNTEKAGIYAAAFGLDGEGNELVSSSTYTIFAYIAPSAGSDTDKDIGSITFDHNKDAAENKTVDYSGDMTGNYDIDSGDYGNVMSMINNDNAYTMGAVDVESRLRADVAVTTDTTEGNTEGARRYGTIDDVEKIMKASVGITT